VSSPGVEDPPLLPLPLQNPLLLQSSPGHRQLTSSSDSFFRGSLLRRQLPTVSSPSASVILSLLLGGCLVNVKPSGCQISELAPFYTSLKHLPLPSEVSLLPPNTYPIFLSQRSGILGSLLQSFDTKSSLWPS